MKLSRLKSGHSVSLALIMLTTILALLWTVPPFPVQAQQHEPWYLPNGRTMDEQRDYIFWDSSGVSNVNFFHKSNTTFTYWDGNAWVVENCNDDCTENVTKIEVDHYVRLKIKDAYWFSIMVAEMTDYGSVDIYMCGALWRSTSLDTGGGAQNGVPGMTNYPGKGTPESLRDVGSAGCDILVYARGKPLYLRAVDAGLKPLPPTVDLKIDNTYGPGFYANPGEFTLTWSSSGADTCDRFGAWSWTGTPANGSQVISGKAGGNRWNAYDYYLRCSGLGGVGQSNTVRAYVYNPTSTDVKINGFDTTMVLAGSTATVTWTADTNAYHCVGANGLAGIDVYNTYAGSKTVTAWSTTTYTMNCYNELGQLATDMGVLGVLRPVAVETLINGVDGPVNINAGTGYTVEWASWNASSCTGDFAGGNTVPGWNGPKALWPDARVFASSTGGDPYTSYLFRVSCSNALSTGSDTEELRVYNPAPVDVKINGQDSFTATTGDTVTVTWSGHTNATSCTGYGGLAGYNTRTGSVTLPNVTTGASYRMDCQNAMGQVSTDTSMLTVVAPPTVDVRVNGGDTPAPLPEPATYAATWTSTNATSCTGSNRFAGYNGTNGTRNEASVPAGTYTYTQTCSNAAGRTATDSVAIVIYLPPPTVDLKINGLDGPILLIGLPGSYNLSWTSTRAYSGCTSVTDPATASWTGAKVANGSQNLTNVPYGTYLHYLTCTNASGSATDMVEVQIGEPLSGTIFSEYTGLIYNGPNVSPPIGPLACQRMYGVARGGVGPYMVRIYTESDTRGTEVLYSSINTASGVWETSPAPAPGDFAVCSGDTLFGTDYLGDWRAWALIIDRDGRTYTTRDFGAGQGTEPAWVVDEPLIHDTP